MIPDGLRSFVDQLRSETDRGVVRWIEYSDIGRRIYLSRQNDYEMRISHSWDDDNERFYVFFGMQMPDGNKAGFSTLQWESDYEVMRQLYELASISAARIDAGSLMGFFKK